MNFEHISNENIRKFPKIVCLHSKRYHFDEFTEISSLTDNFPRISQVHGLKFPTRGNTAVEPRSKSYKELVKEKLKILSSANTQKNAKLIRQRERSFEELVKMLKDQGDKEEEIEKKRKRRADRPECPEPGPDPKPRTPPRKSAVAGPPIPSKKLKLPTPIKSSKNSPPLTGQTPTDEPNHDPQMVKEIATRIQSTSPFIKHPGKFQRSSRADSYCAVG